MTHEPPEPGGVGGQDFDHFFRPDGDATVRRPRADRPRRLAPASHDVTDDTLYRRGQRHADHTPEIDPAEPTSYRPRRVIDDAPMIDEPPVPALLSASLAARDAASSTPEETLDVDHESGLSLFSDDGGDDDEPALMVGSSGGRHERGRRRHPFTQSLLWTALSALVPGLGLLRTKARWLGVAVAAVFLASVVGLGTWAAVNTSEAATVAVRPGLLKAITAGLVALLVLWVITITGTHLLTRPRRRTRVQRAVGALVVGGLSFTVAAPLAVAARYASVQSGVINNVFKKEGDTRSQTRPTLKKGAGKDVWADKPRLNILLVGLDNTAKRDYSDVDVSTDTMMVASIDTHTGDTVIVQVPRNMARVPFPAGSALAERYPSGFYDGYNPDNSSYFANAIWGHAPAEHPDLFENTDYKGADALKLGMEGATGLKIDYFVALNIEGLVKLIDAMGGVRLNVNRRIPVAGRSDGSKAPTGYIEPGPDKLLNGYYAMWYARSRSDSDDYNRMGRQTCVIKGVIDQADPRTMLTRYEEIAKASSEMISTDIPQSALPPIVELATRVKDARQTRVLFVHGKDGFNTTDPDFVGMHQRIQKAIDTVGQASKGAPPTSAKPKPSDSPSTPSRKSTRRATQEPSATPSVAAESLTDACAYNPESEG